MAVLIDLGEVSAFPGPDRDRPGAPAPETAPGLPRPRPPSRWSILAAVLLVLLAGGAATPGPAQVVPLLRVAMLPGGEYGLADGILVVDAGLAVRAYRVAPGAPLWRVPVAGRVVRFLPLTAQRVLLCDFYAPDSASVTVAAFDLDRGEPLWQARPHGYAVLPGAGRVLLAGLDDTGTRTVSSIDVRTGEVRWLRADRGATTIELPATTLDPASRAVFATWDPGGAVSVYDAVSGTPVSAGRVDLSAASPDLSAASPGQREASVPAIILTVQVVGDELDVLTGLWLGEAPISYSFFVSGYDLDTLAWRWSTAVPTGDAMPAGCGPVRCWSAENQVSGVDPVTGARLWTRPAVGAVPLAAQRLLLDRIGPLGEIIDPVTGRTLLALPAGSVLRPGSAGTALVSRAEGTAGAWFWLLDLARDELRPLVYLAGQDGRNCVLDRDDFACRDPHGRVSVWRVQRR